MRIISKLKKLVTKSIILNQVNSNHINADSNHVDSNHANPNKLMPTNWKTTNDSADVRALNKLLSRYGDLMDATDSAVSMRTPLAYAPSIHKFHTISPLNSLYY